MTNDKDNVLTTICSWILSVEFIFLTVLLAAIVYGIIAFKNKDEYFEALVFPATIIIFIDILSVIVTKQVDFFTLYNGWIYCLLGAFVLFINNISFEVINIKFQDNCNTQYSPIDSYDDLFGQRKWQAEELEYSINNHESDEPFSICISGEWGIGKTSFVNAVLDKIKEGKQRHHKSIRINAMDMDSVESLFNYLFSRIKSILKANGYYVGISSEFEEYFSSVAEILSDGKIKPSIFRRIFAKEKDYRDTKEELENLLGKMLGDGNKLIIVVDDIERCSNNKILEFINFIKEVATLKHCVLIFLTDYEQLGECLSGKPVKYLDKFFNHRIDIVKVDYKDVISHFIGNGAYEFRLTDSIKISVLSELDNLITKLHHKIEALEKSKSEIKHDNQRYDKIKNKNSQIEDLKTSIMFIEHNLSNPRNARKILRYISDMCKIVYEKYSGGKVKLQEAEIYLNKVEAVKNIIILSIMNRLMPEKYDRMVSNGFDQYVTHLYNNELQKDRNDRLIIELVSGLWYMQVNFFGDAREYKHIELGKFVTSLISRPDDLDSIVNGYSSEDAMCIAMIENENFGDNDWDLKKLLRAILHNFSLKEVDKGSVLLSKLYGYVFKLLNDNKLTIDIAFNILELTYKEVFPYEPRLKASKIFYEYINQIKMNKASIINLKQILRVIYRECIPESFYNIRELLYYKLTDVDSEAKTIKRAIEDGMFGETFDEVFERILSVISNELSYRFTIKGKTHIEKITNLLKECAEELESLGSEHMPDVKQRIEKAFAQLSEYKYLQKIIDFTNTSNNISEEFTVEDTDFNNIEDKIGELMSQLKNPTIEEFKQNYIYKLDTFFEKVENLSKNNEFPDELLVKLHKLVTECHNSNKQNVHVYRKRILDIQKKQRTNKESKK